MLRHLVIESEHVHRGRRILVFSADVAESQLLLLSFAVVLGSGLLHELIVQAEKLLLRGLRSRVKFRRACTWAAKSASSSRIVLVTKLILIVLTKQALAGVLILLILLILLTEA